MFFTAIRKNGMWTLSLNDTVVRTENVINQTNIHLSGRNAYLGGRPGTRKTQSLIFRA